MSNSSLSSSHDSPDSDVRKSASGAWLPYPHSPCDKVGTSSLAMENRVACEDLAGPSLAVSDTIDAAGFPTSCGNAALLAASGVKMKAAPCVAALESAGARVMGKTVCGELGLTDVEENAHFRAPKNPLDARLSLSGAAGGAACAVAGGESMLALASDCAGSALVPAAQCAVAALRLSAGRVSTEGMFVVGDDLETPAVLASSIETLSTGVETLLKHGDAKELRIELLVPLDLLTFLGPQAFAGFEPVLQKAQAAFGRAAFVNAAPGDLSRVFDAFERLRARAVCARLENVLETLHPKLSPAASDQLAASFVLQQEGIDEAHQLRKATAEHFARLLSSDSAGKEGEAFPILVFPTLPGARAELEDDAATSVKRRTKLTTLYGLMTLTGVAMATIPVPISTSTAEAPINITLACMGNRELELLEASRRLLAAFA